MKQRAVSKPRRKSTNVTPAHDPVTPAARSGGLSAEGPIDDAPARIAVLAYQLYEQRDREDGYHVEDWLQAEQRILAGKS